MPAAASGPIKVLVVDDEPFNRMELQAILEAADYQVFQATNGEEAVAAFSQKPVDIILMDVMMPAMDGYEAIRRIKQITTDDILPVIFLTLSDDDDHLAECIASSGDDFLIKPVTPRILLSKIQAQLRISKLYHTVRQQKDELDQRRLDDLRDHEFAESIFKRIVHLGCLDETYIPYLTSPAALLNGDILLAARTPTSALRIMLGDFTGHGLSAAVGAIPAAEIFYKMTGQGHSLSEVIREINNKLNLVLPTGLFCAAGFAEINYKEYELQTWVGGIPDIIHYSNNRRGISQRFKSDNLPLGVLSDEQFNHQTTTTRTQPDDCVFIYTDGITETMNPEGEMFGQESIEACILTGDEDSWVSPALLKLLKQFSAVHTQSDDITFVELPCSLSTQAIKSDEQQNRIPSSHWKTVLYFEGDTLKHTDPLPLLLRTITELQDLNTHRTNLYTILAELFNNTLDHGLLRLASGLKQSPEGFLEFYELRESRMQKLGNRDYIQVELENIPQGDGGQLFIRVKDSTDGFDINSIPKENMEDLISHSGRGIPLLRSLCESLTYHPPGNCVEAVYRWE